MSQVFVVLSTYNGARFLSAQLESLIGQSFAKWTLLIRDDGSTDDTLDIIRSAQDPRIRLLATNGERVGPVASFGLLLKECLNLGAGRVFLCDQDDVWLPNKMELQLRRMDDAERRLGSFAPLLVHSDLAVVAEDLQLRHSSFLKSQRLRHVGRGALRTLAVQNFVTGCTVLLNRAVLEVAVPIPSQAVMHDWWIGLCAAGAGRLLFEPLATVLYRQHNANTIGSTEYWSNLRRVLGRRTRNAFSESASNEFQAMLAQAEAGADRLADFEPRSARMLAEFVDLWRLPPPRGQRLGVLRRLRIQRLDPLRQLLLQARLWLRASEISGPQEPKPLRKSPSPP